jgi:hypothetical protein
MRLSCARATHKVTPTHAKTRTHTHTHTHTHARTHTHTHTHIHTHTHTHSSSSTSSSWPHWGFLPLRPMEPSKSAASRSPQDQARSQTDPDGAVRALGPSPACPPQPDHTAASVSRVSGCVCTHSCSWNRLRCSEALKAYNQSLCERCVCVRVRMQNTRVRCCQMTHVLTEYAECVAVHTWLQQLASQHATQAQHGRGISSNGMCGI